MTTTLHMFVIYSFFFFFNDTATTEIYTLSLHDALPIFGARHGSGCVLRAGPDVHGDGADPLEGRKPGPEDACTGFFQLLDRKSTRLNSSHANISYAVFCLKKKN